MFRTRFFFALICISMFTAIPVYAEDPGIGWRVLFSAPDEEINMTELPGGEAVELPAVFTAEREALP